jgi:hypothetical protein
MYSMSTDVIRLPNSIVSVVKVDDEGQLWFLCNPPTRQLDATECVFPARLHFYRKGKFFRVEVSGKAAILNNEGAVAKDQKPLLIKMSMINVEYTESPERKPTILESILANTYKWMLRTIAIPRQERSVLSKMQHY